MLYHRTAGRNVYWQCMNKKCTGKRNINEKNLVESVRETLKMHMKLSIDFSKPVAVLKEEQKDFENSQIRHLNSRISVLRKKSKGLLLQAEKGVVSSEDFKELNAFYSSSLAQFQAEKENVFKKRNRLINNIDEVRERYRTYSDLEKLTRELVVTFIEKIVVESKNSVILFFRYADFFINNGNSTDVSDN
jgi:hypothetical protein